MAAKIPPQTFAEIGSVGFKHHAGRLSEEWLADLSGPRGIKRYREINDNISEIGSSLSMIRLVASRAKWKFEPYSPAPEDIERARFFDGLMGDMSHSWPALVRSAMTMLTYGFAPHEIVFKLRADGLIGWGRLPLRPQSTLHHWDIDKQGNVEALYQENASDHSVVKIPYSKLLNFRIRGDEAGPEGTSLLRYIWFDAYRYKNIVTAEAIGTERALAGLPIMRIPGECMVPDAAPERVAVYDEAKRVVQNIRTDEEAGVVISSDTNASGQYLYSLELLSASGSTLPNTSQIVTNLRKTLLQALGTDFVALGHEGVGSYALGDSKVDAFEVALEGYLDLIAEEIQQKLIPLTLKLNAWDESRPPRLVHLPLEKPNLAQLADYISKLTGANVITVDDKLEDAARKAADLPPRDPGGPPRQAPTPEPAPPPPPPPAAAQPISITTNVSGFGKRVLSVLRDAKGLITGGTVGEDEVKPEAGA